MERRPKTWGECQGIKTDCPFVTCKYHLALDVTPGGSLAVVGVDSWPERDSTTGSQTETERIDYRVDAVVRYVNSGKPTCALQVAEDGPTTLEDIGDLIGVTRERVRQIEGLAMLAMRDEARYLRGAVWSYAESPWDMARGESEHRNFTKKRLRERLRRGGHGGGRKAHDLTGKIFGRLTVLSREGHTDSGGITWLVRCSCGTEKRVRAAKLKDGRVRSCGCLRGERRRLTDARRKGQGT